jgi:Fic family protein
MKTRPIISQKEKELAFSPKELFEIEAMTNEIIASSAIEGEVLDRIDVENSVMRGILAREKNSKKMDSVNQ